MGNGRFILADIWKNFVLPEGFSIADLGGLQKFLTENAGSPIRVDTANLRRLDARLVEFLLCASRAWQAGKLDFELVGLSAAKEEALQWLGISPDLLPRGEAA